MMNKTMVTKAMLAAVLLPMVVLPVAAKEVHQVLDAASDGRVTVFNTAGSVELTGWSKNQVEVTADLGWGVDELIFEREKDEIIIKVKVPKNGGRNISSELLIRVPEDSAVDIGVVSADIEVSNLSGEQQLHSVSGDISSEVEGADVEADSVSGDIELVGNKQSIRIDASTVSGDIDAYRLSGAIEATSVSGDIAIVEGAYERVQAETVNGSIDYKAELIDGGKIDFETINGSVDLNLIGSSAARYDLETFNGNIRNCFGPKAERSNRYGPGRELKFTDGSGSSRVTIKTLNGGMTICRD